MNDHADFVERRAPTPTGWHLDKKVPLTLIFAMLTQAAMVVWAVADIKKDVELLKADNAVLHQRDTQLQTDTNGAMGLIRQHLERLEGKLDRLIERRAL